MLNSDTQCLRTAFLDDLEQRKNSLGKSRNTMVEINPSFATYYSAGVATVFANRRRFDFGIAALCH